MSPTSWVVKNRNWVFYFFRNGKLAMKKNEKGSIELIVLALLAALIVVLAIPLLQNLGEKTHDSLEYVVTAIPATPST